MESYNSGRSQGLPCLQKVNWGQENKVVVTNGTMYFCQETQGLRDAKQICQ